MVNCIFLILFDIFKIFYNKRYFYREKIDPSVAYPELKHYALGPDFRVFKN